MMKVISFLLTTIISCLLIVAILMVLVFAIYMLKILLEELFDGKGVDDFILWLKKNFGKTVQKKNEE